LTYRLAKSVAMLELCLSNRSKLPLEPIHLIYLGLVNIRNYSGACIWSRVRYTAAIVMLNLTKVTGFLNEQGRFRAGYMGGLDDGRASKSGAMVRGWET
jgi:hypothetical protein